MILIDGFCPMCGSQTLYAEEMRVVNRIICIGDDCPDPQATHRILSDSSTDHLVTFTGSGFTIRHPLRERIDDALMDCELHLHLMSMPGPPEGRPGVFQISGEGGNWALQRLPVNQESERQADTS